MQGKLVLLGPVWAVQTPVGLYIVRPIDVINHKQKLVKGAEVIFDLALFGGEGEDFVMAQLLEVEP